MSRVGVRTGWSTVPSSVRSGVEDLVGSRVVSTTPTKGGFSPGPAVRAELADGRAVFIKAAGLALNPLSPGMHRREAAVLGVLPPSLPVATLIGVVDDGDWVALVTEWIAGRNPDATSASDVGRLLHLVQIVASQLAPARLLPFAEAHPDLLGNWVKLDDDPPPELDAWSRQHLAELAGLDLLAPTASSGPSLVHADVRTDNVVLAAAGRHLDVMVDWPAACVGADWIDLLGLLPALHLDGGPPPAEVFDHHPLGRAADPAAVDAVLASITGYFVRQSFLPPPPGIPTVRAFQRAQGAIARRWLAERLRLPAPEQHDL